MKKREADMEKRHEEIESFHRKFEDGFFDGISTCSTWIGKLLTSVV